MVKSRCTAGSKSNTRPAMPGSSDHTTRPVLSHTLMCTIDRSCRRLRMIREKYSTRTGSPATNRPSASGAGHHPGEGCPPALGVVDGHVAAHLPGHHHRGGRHHQQHHPAGQDEPQ